MRDFDDNERDEISEISSKVSDQQLADHLEFLANREKEFYLRAASKDADMKEITMWNIGVLCAAADKLNQAQTAQQEAETSQSLQLNLPLPI